MLKIENLDFKYSKKSGLIRELSLTLGNGTICGLLGKNGTGKSTLIYLICGLLRPQFGRISFNGLTPLDRKVEFLEDVFLVPEEFILPEIKLMDYVRVNSPFYPKFSETDFLKYLDLFEMSADVSLGKISMGQKKKVFISFALACNTSLVILDEPTNGLDITAKRNFRKVIAECMTDEKCILISTHQVYDVDKILDRVVIMDKEGILLNNSVEEICKKYKFLFTTDFQRADKALARIDVPGGYNIVEPLEDPDDETEINLETLFELVTSSKNLNQ